MTTRGSAWLFKKGARHRGIRGRPLTAHENTLMEFMVQGFSYKEIAEKTGVSKNAWIHDILSALKTFSWRRLFGAISACIYRLSLL